MIVRKYDLTAAHKLQSNFEESTTIGCGKVFYTAQQIPQYSLSLTDSDNWHMLTWFNFANTEVTPDNIQNLRDCFMQADDVFCADFLKTVLLVTDEKFIDEAVLELLRTWGCLTIFHLPNISEILPGPYFFRREGLFWAWRLYADEQEAFVLSTIASQQDKNTVSVKDVFHLKGVHTSAGNRAFRQLYPAQSMTSAAVQKTIDLGAIVVGKTKTAEFAGSQEVVGDWCDYSYAFNSRGDGYLVSTGSSTGSASGLAAYSWLDFSIGSDAGGSIRDPAVVHGIYGFRPTHDGSATKDAVIPCPLFQVPGFMGRSSASMLDFGTSWLSDRSSLPELKTTKIWFPANYHSDRADVQHLVHEAVCVFAKWLGADIEFRSVEDVWAQGKPSGILPDFGIYFHKTFMDYLKREYWEYTGDFRTEYQTKLGVPPYVCKITQWLWSDGSKISPKRKEETLDEVRTHNNWLTSTIFADTSTFMVCPMYNLKHRDEYAGPPEQRDYYGFYSNLHASMAGLPNIIVPIAQSKYYSAIRDRHDIFPISLSIIGPKGTDISLLHCVEEFLKFNEFPVAVETGAVAFSTI